MPVDTVNEILKKHLHSKLSYREKKLSKFINTFISLFTLNER